MPLPSSTVITTGTNVWSTLNTNGSNHIAYCFHSVTGYSKFGSYTGTGTAGSPSVNIGFRPAFVMVKRAVGGAGEWHIFDSTRNPDDNFSYLSAESSSAEVAWDKIDFTSTGFTIQGDSSNSSINASGNTYIYMAFADTREFAYWLDQSGNNNDWTSNNLTESDISVDSPTNNFCTWNAADNYSAILSEGNLKTTSLADYNMVFGTQSFSTGKYYWEQLIESSTVSLVGVANTSVPPNKRNVNLGGDANSIGYYQTGVFYYNDALNASGYSTFGNGDIIGIACDMDNKTVTWYKNNTLIRTMTFSAWDDMIPAWTIGSGVSGNSDVTNFGQDSSFAGNKTAQGNTDDNEIGDFYYSPPSGYLALCTANLPDPDVIPSEHFNTVLYTGDGTDNRAVTGLGFQPDFTWIKARSEAHWHVLTDSVRGNGRSLYSNATNAENLDYLITSLDADGFTVDINVAVNKSGFPFVAWNWKANGSGVSNTNGSITSTVSANQDAGFSIVGWTGNGNSDVPIGHGLNSAPELYVLKGRDASTNWNVYTTVIDGSLDFGLLPSTAAFANSSLTAPTATTIRTSGAFNVSGENNIAYAFHSVDGFSKVGSYIGNGSADGTFVYTGFRVAYVMYKRYDSTGGWRIADNPRSGYRNEVDQVLRAESSSAEGNYAGTDVDFLSNGFKLRGTDSIGNTSGGNYIYIAFAEHPFKHTNAR